ncbi:MAG: type II secretion system protein [Phycisphaerae bacterium]
MCTRLRRAVAFTLIELLAVVAIIALLVAILVPTLRTARELARRSICGTHMRSVSLGIHMYCQDNREIVAPRFFVLRNDPIWIKFWADFITPYFDSDCKPGVPGPGQSLYSSVGLQPSDGIYTRSIWGVSQSYSRRLHCASGKLKTKDGSWPMHYSWNIAFGWQGEYGSVGQFSWTTGVQMLRLKNHQRLVQVVEPDPMDWWSINLAADSGQYRGAWEPGFYGLVPYGYQQPHMDTGNALFLDGHVEVFTKQFILDFARKPYYTVANYPFYLPG